jgi:hypothetical protein
MCAGGALDQGGRHPAEVSALAAQGDIDEIERVIAESYTLRGQAAPIWLIGRAALEFSVHGWEKESRVYAERVLAELRQWPDSLDRAGMMYLRDALAILGRYADAARLGKRKTPKLATQVTGNAISASCR